ncbi:hypothetical protein HAPAU_20670 [Halalkalicoccus paucihalophilus]|uniref:Uncharacterized protein n=1 Tax=Halalkalicoccus paucihalophilus TaxID=1008153 RepID=A0A151ACG7_9EURY|nr:hypothetical protein [Halalkalicoccus paucihalophilus]KYH25396.1 hypothetical protein HAPAU_20670 [Halalkalicoccus paucihalophilus]
MADERIRDELESERRESRAPVAASEDESDASGPTPGDRITLYHRHPEGFGDGRVAEGRLVRFDGTMVSIARDDRTLGVRPGELTAWEWVRRDQ